LNFQPGEIIMEKIQNNFSERTIKMQCLSCNGEVEYAAGEMYARCKTCKSLFMNVAGNWQPYPMDESMRAMMEQSLGFSPSVEAPAKPLPTLCPQCQGSLEKVETEESIITRCDRCGILSSWDGNWLMPVIVEAPGGGWNGEFQALFEKNLGFTYKVRKFAPGVPE
jgi:Zn finger protein HypA/HybF involved in hydrogenase expression